MKKIFTIFLLICLLSVILFIFKDGDNNDKKNINSFLISNNENGVFDGTLVKESNVLFDVPFECPAIPFNDSIYDIHFETIDNIKPYYSFYMYRDELELDFEINYSINNQNRFQAKALPVNLEENNYYLPMVVYKVVFDDEKFMDKHNKNNVIIKKFNADSGVFLAQPIYEYLEIEEDCESLIIEVPVIVPLVAEMQEGEIHSSTYSYTSTNYSVSQYEIVYVKMEVEGVIKTDNVGLNFCLDLGVVIPYELSKSIYDSVDRSNIVLGDNQMLYSPNTYHIEVSKGYSIEDVGKELLEKIGPVFIQEYEYDNSHYYRINVFNENEVLYYPKL